MAIEDLPESIAADGTTVIVGDPSRTPVRLYQDIRCTGCRYFEVQGGGPALLDMTLGKEVRTEYTLVSSPDDRAGDTGSKRAVNALRAALELDRFAEYHAILFANQPQNPSDGYTDAFLLAMASKVKGLRGLEFDTAVKQMRYADFVAASHKAYLKAGSPALPAADINGTLLSADKVEVLLTKDMLPVFVDHYSHSR
jgi:protein-disulfide isomerase